MPTAARMVAALFLAALAFFASELVKGQMAEETAFGIFSPLNAGM